MTATNLTSREQVREPVSSLDRGLQGRRESEKERERERERESWSQTSPQLRVDHTETFLPALKQWYVSCSAFIWRFRERGREGSDLICDDSRMTASPERLSEKKKESHALKALKKQLMCLCVCECVRVCVCVCVGVCVCVYNYCQA